MAIISNRIALGRGPEVVIAGTELRKITGVKVLEFNSRILDSLYYH